MCEKLISHLGLRHCGNLPVIVADGFDLGVNRFVGTVSDWLSVSDWLASQKSEFH